MACIVSIFIIACVNFPISIESSHLLSKGFVIFVQDTRGFETAVNVEPEATVSDLIAELSLEYATGGIVYGDRLLGHDELLTDAGICAQSKVALLVSVNHLMPKDFIATDDIQDKIIRMFDIFPLDSMWSFQGIVPRKEEDNKVIADFPENVYNGVSFRVAEIGIGGDIFNPQEENDKIVIDFRDSKKIRTAIWVEASGNITKIDEIELETFGFGKGMDKWMSDVDDLQIMRIS